MSDRKSFGPDPLVAIGDVEESPGLDAIRAWADLSSQGKGAVLVTVVGAEGSVPRGMGAAMTVRADGSIVGTIGGGNLELLLIEHAMEALEDGRPRRYRYDFTGGPERNIEKSCMGRCEFFVQPSVQRPPLYIFGAGHIGIALAPMAQQAGFRVTVIDSRPDYPALATLPEDIATINVPFDEAVAGLEFDDSTFVVAVTYGHATDVIVLRECLEKPWCYLGMIGSRAKVHRTIRELGTDEATKQKLAQVHAPIGLDIGGREPGEVAVSIVAELVAVRHGNEDTRSMRGRAPRRKNDNPEPSES
ncbi:xanthine dehydrogenase [bacterium]|nr:MAG: xanthine dehydrogenase [bacterium]RKZ15249.1 MAG: xanthine dehydrogenase [bacterium]